MFEKYNMFTRVAHSLTDVLDYGHDYPDIDIDAPCLTTNSEAMAEMNAGKKAFKNAVHKFLKGSTKQLILKSRYGNGKTTCIRRLMNNLAPE